MHWVRTALLLSALVASRCVPSIAAEAPCHVARLALVIGNGSYADSDAPLREPIGDARELGDALQRLGFVTTEAENLTQDRMRSAIEAFEQKVTSDAVAFVFFAGYGIQSGGHTYLIPVDAAIWNEQDIKTVGFSLDRILSDLADRGARLRFVIVDGARRNPYERRFRPTGSQGMAAVNGTPGVLALYSSLPGTTFDESGGNTSPFVDALITALGKPGARAEEAFRKAKADATRVYRGTQTPWVSSFLDEDVALEGGDCHVSHPATAEAAPPPSSVSPAPPAKTPPARPAVAMKVPARPVSAVVPPAPATAPDPSPPPAPVQAPPPPPPPSVPEQTTTAAAVPVAPPPAPARPAPEMPKPQPAPEMAKAQQAPAATPPVVVAAPPAVVAAPPAVPAPTVEAPPPPPATAPRLAEAVPAAEPPPAPPPAASTPPRLPSPPPAPRQDVATAVPPSPAAAEDPDADDPIVDAARLKEVKDRLFDQGLNPGDPGSPAMAAAIRTYEEETGLPIVTQPTVRLLSNLRGRPLPGPWASLALSRDLKHWGMAWNEKSRRTAIAEAKGRCGAEDCSFVDSFSGPHCGAVAISDDVGWSMMWRHDAEQARAAALDRCAKSGPQCRIIGAVCADGSDRFPAPPTREGQR